MTKEWYEGTNDAAQILGDPVDEHPNETHVALNPKHQTDGGIQVSTRNIGR